MGENLFDGGNPIIMNPVTLESPAEGETVVPLDKPLELETAPETPRRGPGRPPGAKNKRPRKKAATRRTAPAKKAQTAPAQQKPVLGMFPIAGRDGFQQPLYATADSSCFDLRAYMVLGTKVNGYSAANSKISRPARNMPITRGKASEPGIYINSGDRMLIPTGIIFDIPAGYGVRLHPRSGTAYKSGLVLANQEAVIDSDYVLETFILITNTSDQRQFVQHGERIAQGELVKTYTRTDLKMVILDTAPGQKTDRIGGLGSTGTT